MVWPKVAIIILNWNQKAFSIEALESLSLVDYPDREVIFVDNASSDGSAEEIENIFPEVRVLRNSENLGVAGGRNRGLMEVRQGDAEFIAFLDNDAIYAADFLKEMIRAAMEHPEAGILGPKFYFYDDRERIWAAGGTIDFFRCNIQLRGFDEIDRGQYDRLEETEHVPGAGLMIRRRVLDEIGLYDEGFTRYFAEDTDWCVRVRKAGHTVLYVPGARVWHRVSKTSGGADYFFLKGRNLFYFMRKHARLHHWLFFCFYMVAGVIKVLVRETARGNFRGALAMYRGGLQSLGMGRTRERK